LGGLSSNELPLLLVYYLLLTEEITLKQGAIEMYFPLIRWKMFETYLEDVDEAVEQIRNNRYSSVIEHLGGNVYLTVLRFVLYDMFPKY
jgi:hypothetical protein